MYNTEAASLAEEIAAEFAEIEDLELIIERRDGELHSFDVFVEDKLIFSKFEEGRFPNTKEIVDYIIEYLHEDKNP